MNFNIHLKYVTLVLPIFEDKLIALLWKLQLSINSIIYLFIYL